MTRFSMLFSLVIVLVVGPGCNENVDNPGDSTDPAKTGSCDDLAFLDAKIACRVDQAVADGFSGSILITVGGRPLLVNGYGLANRSEKIPNTASTAFGFGSVIKPLTAAAIFKLEEQGLLDRTATLADVFADVPADKADITLLQVILHQAGFAQYHDTQGDFEPMTRLQARQRIFDQTLRFAPGTDTAYSNAGFTLLADVIETVSGQEFTTYMHEKLLAPAGMVHSSFIGEDIWQPGQVAIGYDARTFESNDPSRWPYTWALVGNGGLVTTVSDMERWLVALQGGQVLSPATFDAYYADYLSAESIPMNGGEVFLFAGGGDYGIGAFAIEAPFAGLRVILTSNARTAFDIEKFGEELARMFVTE